MSRGVSRRQNTASCVEHVRLLAVRLVVLPLCVAMHPLFKQRSTSIETSCGAPTSFAAVTVHVRSTLA